MSSPPPVNLSDLEAMAEGALDPASFAYYAGGANDEVTLRANQAAWLQYRFRPRVMVDVSVVDASTTLLGAPVAMPAGVAPTALHGLGHPEAEVATATAASEAGALFVASTLSSRPMEDLAELNGPRWFQLYTHADRAITADLVERAVATGHQALVVTADRPVLGRREREVRAGFRLPDTVEYGNFTAYAADGDSAAVAAGLHASLLTWAELEGLRGLTDLPLVVKGVLTGEDAALACEHGAAGVWVSNHGGRQLDRTPAGVDVLAEVVDAVAGRAEVYLDGGVRRGADVVVALALGARAAFAGRPWLYALATGGRPGVAHALSLLRAEVEAAMAFLGTPAVDQIGAAHLA